MQIQSMNWSSIAPDFSWDGSLRDIYVLDTHEGDWQTVWDVLIDWMPPPILTIDGQIVPVPRSVLAVLKHPATVLLSFNIGSIQLACHFFTPDEIEFDLDPRDVTGETEAKMLASFLEMLGETTRKAVILTHENYQQALIARYSLELSGVVWTANSSS